MEHKDKTPEEKRATRILYIAVAATLCITAIIIGIVSAANRETPEVPDLDAGASVSTPDESKPPEETPKPDTADKPPVLKAPTTGVLTHLHSMTEPIFSSTMNDWRVHKGIDISTEGGAAVLAAADGEITEIEKHPMMGTTVKIEHTGGMVTVYQNLGELAEGLAVGDLVKCGDVIASVGESALLESAAEPHLHFEVIVSGAQVDPLLHIDEASKESSFTPNDENYEG